MRKTVPKKLSVESTIKCIRSLFFILAFLPLFSQEDAFASSVAPTAQTVSGQVLDADGNQPLPGVSIQLKGTVIGANTDANGRYSIEATGSDAVLVFSFVGYVTQEIQVGNRTELNVTLAADSKALEEVVVIGYGTVKKKDATGAVTAIAAKDFQQGVITSPEQLMQGRAPGVQITQSSGEPGGPINVRIRGTSSVYGGNNPLFVIDGVPLSGDNTSSGSDTYGVGRQSAKNPLNFLNPDDIASMDILKDASATAIYGSRGANGVVFITTKKGKGKGSLDYGFSMGTSTITKKYDLLNAKEFAAANPAQDLGSDTDWQKELFRTAYTQQHNLSYGGGDATGNYRFSLGYMDQNGIVKNSGIKRYSVGFSGTKKFINNRLTLGSSVNLANTKDSGVPISETAGYEGDLLSSTLKSNPTMPVFVTNSAGERIYNQVALNEPNPAAFLNYSRDNTNTLRALGNVNAELEIISGLKFKTVLGFDQSLSARKMASSRDLRVNNVFEIGRAYFNDVETNNSLWENYFTYDKELKNTTLNFLLGYSYQSFETATKNSTASGFRTADLDLMINNSASATTSLVQNTSSIKDELQSYFGRANVSFKNKYLLTGTLRIDGSSKFGDNNKYGIFPSFAGKWKIIEEDFMQEGAFSDLALRVGYGVTGNQAIPHNVYQRRDRYGNWNINGVGTGIEGGGLNAVAFENRDLKWETTKSWNIGVDFGLIGNRLSGSVEVYQKNTKDLLFQIFSPQPAPNQFGWQNLNTNIENKGVELALNYLAVEKNDFSWDINFNVAYNHNLVKDLLGDYNTGQINGQGLSGAFSQRISAGQPLFAFYLREFAGFNEDGNSIYPNGNVQQFLGGKSPLPKVTGGLTNNFKYKNFDLNIFFNGVFGNYIYSNTANAFFTGGSLANGRNVTRDVVGNGEGRFNAPDVSTRFLEKGDFVRLQNATLSYRVPIKANNVISGLRLSLTGQNLFTFTKYSGQDPEVSTNKQMNNIPSFGIDFSSYPRARTWTFGANFSF